MPTPGDPAGRIGPLPAAKELDDALHHAESKARALSARALRRIHLPEGLEDLIEMFLRDRINRWVLSFMALGAAHVLWVDYIIGPQFAPTWSIAIAVYMAMVGWALLIPYFFYVVRFVDPSRVV